MLLALLALSAPAPLNAVTFDDRPGKVYVLARDVAKATDKKLEYDKVTGLARLGGEDLPVDLPKLFDGAILLPASSGLKTKTGAKRVSVDLSKQEFWAWQGDLLVMHTKISSGRNLKDTPPGDYRTGRKEEMHISTIYGSKMPFSVHLRGPYFIHGSELTLSTPGSHGCVRLPMYNDAAQWFYGWVSPGTPVKVRGKRPALSKVSSGASVEPTVQFFR